MYKIKDIFDFDSNEENNNKKDSQLERMKQLNETFQKRGEFIKDKEVKNINENKLKEETDRLKKLTSHRNVLKEHGNDGIPFMGISQAGQGQTVNTFLPTIADAAKNTSFSYIKPEEALEIAIKRAIESGTPINNMSFYEEVNWILNNLGFDSKSAVDIKTAMIKIIGGDLNTSLG
jgi:hypothetical protein